MEGIKKAIACNPVLIFLDLVMPELNGIKMLQVIKSMEELKNVPTIIMSANTNRSNVITALKLGADKVIKKPLQKELILKTISELCGSNFLSTLKNDVIISEDNQAQITKQLRSYFHSGFSIKESSLQLALNDKNPNLLSTIVHEIKGEGSMIGYNELTDLSKRAESELSIDKIDWDIVGYYCYRIISFVREKENLN